jgi:glycosyltransferase involved in cell wall biosynthesis
MKGVLLLLGTLHLLHKSGHAVELELAGDGPLSSLLQERASALGIAHCVHLLGKLPRQELMDLYGSADLFFFPSLHDSSGNVVLEALSRGLPVLCLDLGGPKHYVTPECGVVVATGHRSRVEIEQAFAREIERLMLDRPLLARMSKQALAHAEAQDWAACVSRVYTRIEERMAWRARRPGLPGWDQPSASPGGQTA